MSPQSCASGRRQRPPSTRFRRPKSRTVGTDEVVRSTFAASDTQGARHRCNAQLGDQAFGSNLHRTAETARAFRALSSRPLASRPQSVQVQVGAATCVGLENAAYVHLRGRPQNHDKKCRFGPKSSHCTERTFGHVTTSVTTENRAKYDVFAR